MRLTLTLDVQSFLCNLQHTVQPTLQVKVVTNSTSKSQDSVAKAGKVRFRFGFGFGFILLFGFIFLFGFLFGVRVGYRFGSRFRFGSQSRIRNLEYDPASESESLPDEGGKGT